MDGTRLLKSLISRVTKKRRIMAFEIVSSFGKVEQPVIPSVTICGIKEKLSD